MNMADFTLILTVFSCCAQNKQMNTYYSIQLQIAEYRILGSFGRKDVGGPVSGGFVPWRFRPLEVSSHLFSYFPINTDLIHLVLKQHL